MNKLFRSKGKRIQYTDTKLLTNFILRNLMILFLFVMTSFFLPKALRYSWEEFSLFQISALFQSLDPKHLVISLLLAIFICGIVSILYYRFCQNRIRQMKHRQAIADMIVANKWHNSETKKVDGFFPALTGDQKKEYVTYFPVMYYKFKDSRIYLSVKSTMGRSQDSLMQLEKKIETGLFCEFVGFQAKEPYYEYVFYYDLANTRINIQNVFVKDGEMELMKGFAWNFDRLPHALIVGGTGSGKTYLLLTLIQALSNSGANLHILDPKNSDLADLLAVLPNVYHNPDDIVESIHQFTAEMLQLNQEMKSLTHYKTGGNYASLGLKPHFLIFDEYVAFIEMLDRKQGEAVLSKLKQIAMLGRQTGFFLILACQRPDAKYLQDGLRDQFHFRVAMGKNSELGYTMLFGDTKKKFLDMPSGRGYADMGKHIVSEFYAPFVPKGYDFLEQIQKSALNRTPFISKKEIKTEISKVETLKLEALKLKSSKKESSKTEASEMNIATEES